MMQLKTFYFNPYRECTYVLWNEGLQRCLLIDAGMYGDQEEKRIADFLAENSLIPVTLLITHTHPDHICGVDFLQHTYGLSPIVYPSEGKLSINGFPEIEVIRTPGHKEDAVCYYIPSQGWLFTGDTLFQESIGRTDLPGGDMSALMLSLQQLLTLPDDTEIYPGHGYTSTIGHERNYNPFISHTPH